jgi:superfamily II DNA or RNA helicase
MRRVTAICDGNFFFVRSPSPKLQRVLSNLLTYNRTAYAKRKNQPPGMESLPVECFEIVEVPGQQPRFVAQSGYLYWLTEELEKFGFDLYVKNRPWPKDMSVYEPQWDRVKDVTWRYRQKATIKAMIKNERGRICWPTGAGKTFTITQICRLFPKARIDISTNSVDVINDIYISVSKACTSVAMISSKSKMRHARINCVSGKSLHHMDGKADILIIDEGQEWATDDSMEKLARYRYAKVFMFSANRIGDRADKADFELRGVFGEELSYISYQEAVDHDMVVPMEVRWYNCSMAKNPCQNVENSIIKKKRGIWHNRERNRLIAKIVSEFDDEDQVLIVVDTVSHAMHLKRELPTFTLCHGEIDFSDRLKYEQKGFISKDEPMMTFERRMRIKKRFETGKIKKVIATGVWNRGVDFRNLAVLVRADGKNSRIADTQVPGRVSRTRLDGCTKTGIVIDLVDVFDENFADRSADRRKCYARHNWRQVLMRFDDHGKSHLRRVVHGAAPRQQKLFA